MSSSDGSKANPGFSGHWVPPLARTLIRVVTASLRLRRVGFETLDSLEAEGKRVILAFFHGRQFILTGCLAGRKLSVMASLSRDGELQARTMAGFGFRVVRGSASRGAVRGLIGLMRLMRDGYNPTFAVDGPRGPIHEVKPGAVYLAKKAGVPVVPMASSASPAHIFRRAWDRYLLPLPFARGAAILGEPMHFDRDMSDDAVRKDCEALEKELLRLQESADRMVGLREP
ncbi:MAG: lysophospholipid acyltransferase family protein [bacterium]|nr:MAG: lysophospholipid acyltransferase family protein [bacterium]